MGKDYTILQRSIGTAIFIAALWASLAGFLWLVNWHLPRIFDLGDALWVAGWLLGVVVSVVLAVFCVVCAYACWKISRFD